jgi:hypothetical protein
MIVEIAVPFLIYLGLLFVYRWITWTVVLPFLRKLLYGPINRLSTNYFLNLAKHQFEIASQQNDPSRAWEEIAVEKVREIGHSRFPYDKRRQNLLYIKNSKPNKRIATGLIDVLPLQRNLSFQQEIVCLICNMLDRIGEKGKTNDVSSGMVASSLSAPLQAWSDMLSAWAASGTLLLFIWTKIDSYRPILLGLLCLLNIGFLVFPIHRVNIKPSSMRAYISFSVFVVLAVLALNANINHAGINHISVDLARLGYPGTRFSINHPKWIIYNDIFSCDKSNTITLLVESGVLPSPVKFIYDNRLFSARNSECKEFVPIADENNTKVQAFEYYLLPLDMRNNYEQKIIVRPVLVFPDKEVLLDEIIINIEPPYWRIIRLTFVYIAGGAASLSYILAQLISSLRRREN